MQEVIMVPILEILRNTTESCDFGEVADYGDDFWPEVIRVKSRDTGFGHLVESIQEHGFSNGSAIGYNREDGYISEGHHRLVAAILLGLDEVPTTVCGSDGHPTLGPGHRVSAHFHTTDPYAIEVAA